MNKVYWQESFGSSLWLPDKLISTPHNVILYGVTKTCIQQLLKDQHECIATIGFVVFDAVTGKNDLNDTI